MIALIPARLGSKRFPGKNRASLRGKSLLEIALDSAVQSGVIERVYISTDDDELIDQSRDLGIEVPYKRSADLSQDTSSSWEVVTDFVSRTNYSGDLCLLQLTSPLRKSIDIKNLFEIYKTNNSNQALTVRQCDTQPGVLTHWLCDCNNLIELSRHCQYSKSVCPNGSVYIVNSSTVSISAFDPLAGSSAGLMPEERSLDVDFAHQLESLI